MLITATTCSNEILLGRNLKILYNLNWNDGLEIIIQTIFNLNNPTSVLSQDHYKDLYSRISHIQILAIL